MLTDYVFGISKFRGVNRVCFLIVQIAHQIEFRGADLLPLKRRQHRPMTYWLAWEEPRAVGDLVHVEKFFARNLGGLIHARTSVPGRLGKATSRTPSMYVDKKSDEAMRSD